MKFELVFVGWRQRHLSDRRASGGGSMQNALLLQQQNYQLQAENQYWKKRSNLGHAGHQSAVVVVLWAIIDASAVIDSS